MKLPVLGACLVLLLPAPVHAQEWTFESYTPDGSFWHSSTFRLTETSRGGFSGRFHIPDALPCMSPSMRATVTHEPGHQIITLASPMRGCDEQRLVLKTDGSGGQREVKQPDGSWKWDGRERGLKRK